MGSGGIDPARPMLAETFPGIAGADLGCRGRALQLPFDRRERGPDDLERMALAEALFLRASRPATRTADRPAWSRRSTVCWRGWMPCSRRWSPSNDERRHFLAVYTRTTAAVRDELAHPTLGGFVDPGVDRALGPRLRRALPGSVGTMERRRDRSRSVAGGVRARGVRAARPADPPPPAGDERAHQLRPPAGAARGHQRTRSSTIPSAVERRGDATTRTSTRSSRAACPRRTGSSRRPSSPVTGRCSIG